MTGYVRRALVIPRRMTNAELQALTQTVFLQTENSENLQFVSGTEIAANSGTNSLSVGDINDLDYVVVVQGGVTKNAPIALLKGTML